MRQDDAPVRAAGFVPLLGQSEIVTRVVGHDRTAGLGGIVELGLIGGPEVAGLPSGLTVNSVLCEDRGQDD